MDNLERLDVALGDALEILMVSAELVRKSSVLKVKPQLRRIGNATNLLWEIREAIYSIDPGLEHSTPSEASRTEEEYAKMESLSESAHRSESLGHIGKAIDGFERLRANSTSVHFRRLAEAGLYRVKIADVK